LFREEEFWEGPMHESVMVYGFVRKAFWIGSWAYAKEYNLDVINIILSNMYGPEDHFEEERSHALGALIMKFVTAKKNNEDKVTVWGTGNPVREWLHIDDGAEAMIRALTIEPQIDPINVGVGQGVTILETAELIKKYVGYEGDIVLDTTKPDGAPYKTVCGDKGEKIFNWKPSMGFEEGVKSTIEWYGKNRRDSK
ncbi:MAG: NAD-dependent epimerase/dehydratase family protein, partial [Candidatus Omnitrophica bacterium]|nr:NAD-dependent epimerase/dehydratase family protein [Candidatus Omnitrophota bacterium]